MRIAMDIRPGLFNFSSLVGKGATLSAHLGSGTVAGLGKFPDLETLKVATAKIEVKTSGGAGLFNFSTAASMINQAAATPKAVSPVGLRNVGASIGDFPTMVDMTRVADIMVRMKQHGGFGRYILGGVNP